MFIFVSISVTAFVGCSNGTGKTDKPSGSHIVIHESQTSIHIVVIDGENEDLLSIAYRITNQSKDRSDPVYINYVIHGQTLSDALGFSEYSPFKLIGGGGMQLEAGEVYQGGDSIGVSRDISGLIQQDEDNQAIEIQVVDVGTKEVLASHKVNKVTPITDTAQ